MLILHRSDIILMKQGNNRCMEMLAVLKLEEGCVPPLSFGLHLREIQRLSIIQDKRKRPFFLT